MTYLPRIAARIFNAPLLITPDAADAIVSSLADRFGVEPVSARAGRPEKRDEKPYGVDNAARAAILPIQGELVNRGDWLDAASGLLSYQTLARWLSVALTDDDVDTIVLDVDSPGGEAAGAMESAALVRQAATTKPVIAVVNGMAASAAYAQISGASQIVAMPSANLGSIGVVWIHADRSGQMEQRGIKPTILQAGDYKTDGHPYAALPDGARSRIQARINATYDLFVNTVAAHRPIEADAIRRQQAGLFMGQAAVDAGLADRIGSLDDVLNSLRASRAAPAPLATTKTSAAPSNSGAGRARAATQGQTMTEITQEALAAAVAEATASACTAERTRIQTIFTSEAAKGREKSAQHLAFKTSLSSEDAIAALAGLEVAPAQSEPPQQSGSRLRSVPNPPIDAVETGGVKPDDIESALSASVDALIGGKR